MSQFLKKELLTSDDAITNQVVSEGEIVSGAVISGTDILDMSYLEVYGGTVIDTTVGENGFLNMYEGVLSNVTVSSGGAVYANTYDDDSLTRNLTIKEGGSAFIDGSMAENTTVESGGSLNGFDFQSKTVMASGIHFNNVIVRSWNFATIADGQSGQNISVESDASLMIYGGNTDNVKLSSGAFLYAMDGTITNVDWAPGKGTVAISEDADLTFTGNYSGIYYKKSPDDTVYSQAQNLSNMTFSALSSGYDINVMSGGTLDGITASDCGMINVYGGGIVKNTTVNGSSETVLNVNSGATVSTVTIANGGRMAIYGGSVNGVTVSSGGQITAATDGGCLDNVVIGRDGYMTANGDIDVEKLTVSSGGMVFLGEMRLCGELQIEDGGNVEISELDLDLTERTVEDGYMINDLSKISNLEEIYISLEVRSICEIGSGTYKLAQGAEDFDGDIFIDVDRSGGGESIKYEIAVGETIKTSGGVYTLNCENGNLTVTVDVASTSPEVCGNFGTKGDLFILDDDGSAVITSASGMTTVSGKVDFAKWDLLGVGDFNKSGTDGLLWRSRTDNSVYMQNDLTSFNELGKAQNRLGVLEEGYEIRGTGDFSGSGIDGVVMKGPAFGDASISLNYGLPVWARDENGNTFNGWLGALVNTWKPGDALKGDKTDLADINAKNYMYDIFGVGDFNGDGVDDVLLMNTMPEYVDGVRITGYGDVFTFLTGDVDAVKAGEAPTVAYAGCAVDEWEIFGVGDFNGDGIDDVLLCDDNGNIAGWKMANGQRSGDFWFGNVGEDVGVSGVTDCNGDGTDDIVFCDEENDQFAWLIKDGTVNQVVTLA